MGKGRGATGTRQASNVMPADITPEEREARELSRIYGVDPRAIGMHYESHTIIRKPTSIEAESGVEAGDLCVYTRDDYWHVEDEGARLLPNFRTRIVRSPGEYDYTSYYIKPLDKECQGVQYCELPNTSEVRRPAPRKVVGHVVVYEGVRYLWLASSVPDLRGSGGEKVPFDPNTCCYVLTGELDGLHVEGNAWETYCVCQKGHGECLVTACPDFAARADRREDDGLDGKPYSCALCKKRERTVAFNRPVEVTCEEREWSKPPVSQLPLTIPGMYPSPLFTPTLNCPSWMAHLVPQKCTAHDFKRYLTATFGIYVHEDTETHVTYSKKGTIKSTRSVPIGKHYMLAELELTTAAGPTTAHVKVYCDPPAKTFSSDGAQTFPNLKAAVDWLDKRVAYYRNLLKQAADVKSVELVTKGEVQYPQETS